MQEAASFQSASYQQEFDTGKHRVAMVKDFNVLSDGRIADLYPSACSTSQLLLSSFSRKSADASLSWKYVHVFAYDGKHGFI